MLRASSASNASRLFIGVVLGSAVYLADMMAVLEWADCWAGRGQKGECRNMESIEEQAERGSVVLTIAHWNSTQLTSSGIEECLRYML